MKLANNPNQKKNWAGWGERWVGSGGVGVVVREFFFSKNPIFWGVGGGGKFFY